MKTILTAILILSVSFASAQKQIVYSAATVDSILSKTTAQIGVLQNQINQQQAAINGLSANQRPIYMDPLYFILSRSLTTDSITLKTPIIVR